MEAIWSVVTVVGPVLLIAALIWAYLVSRSASPPNLDRAERRARELRRRLEEDEARRSAP